MKLDPLFHTSLLSAHGNRAPVAARGQTIRPRSRRSRRWADELRVENQTRWMWVRTGRNARDSKIRKQVERHPLRAVGRRALGWQSRGRPAADGAAICHQTAILAAGTSRTGMPGSDAGARRRMHMHHGCSRRDLTGHSQRKGQEQHQNAEAADERAQHAQTT